MALVPGVDSAQPPLITEIQQAVTQGYRWWGCYLSGVPNTDPLYPWLPSQIDLLRRGGILAVPITVPIPTLGGDPIETAQAAIASARAAGLSPGISILYDGVGLRFTGQVTGPIWLPEPGPVPSSVGSMSAVQYGYGSIGTIAVDLNVASPDFPFSNGIVCDFEANILDYVKPAIALDWYHEFQSVFPVVPEQPEKEDMPFIVADSTGTWLVANDLSRKVQIDNVSDVGTFEGMGFPVAQHNLTSTATLATIPTSS
jgi:hypothetical protein